MAQLLRNDTRSQNQWVALHLLTGDPPRTALGARILARVGEREMPREVRVGGSYLSQSEPWILLGLGQAPKVDRLEVRWPSGEVEELRDIPSGHRHRIVEGVGIVDDR